MVVAASAVGALAFGVVQWQPASYLAEATAVVSRAPADIDFGSGLRFRPEVNVGLDTYRTLAFSRPVLQELAERFDLPLPRLQANLDLETVSSAAAFLAVDHQVRNPDPQVAAAIANAWAAISVQRAQELLLESLDVVELITGEGLELARARVSELEERLDAVQSRKAARLAEIDRSSVRRVEALIAAQGVELAGLVGGVDLAALLGGNAQLGRASAALVEVIGDVEAQLRSAEGEVRSQRALLASLEAAPAGELQVVLAAAPEQTLSRAGAIATIETTLSGALEREGFLRGELAALQEQARRERAALLAFEIALADLRSELRIVRSEVELGFGREVAQVQRDLADALREYQTLAPIEPGVALAAQIAPAGARVLSQATPPAEPESNRALLIALLAFVVTGFAALVMVLLAEAVRDPSATPARTPPAPEPA